MGRVVITGDTTADLYETTNNASARMFYVVSDNLSQPSGAQIEAGSDAAGAPAMVSGSAAPVVGENGPFAAYGLTKDAPYKAFFAQNLSAYKGHLQGFIGQIGSYTFTRAGTQDGIDSAGDTYTAAENDPAYILNPETGALLQEEGFEGDGVTLLSNTFSTMGLNSVRNNICGQLVFTTRKDSSGYPALVFLNLSGGAFGDAIELNTSGTGQTFYCGKRKSGATTTVASASTQMPSGTRIDLRWKVSAVTGMTLWVDGVRTNNNDAAALTGIDADITSVVVAGRHNNVAHTAITAEIIRIVDADLSDAEIEAW